MANCVLSLLNKENDDDDDDDEMGRVRRVGSRGLPYHCAQNNRGKNVHGVYRVVLNTPMYFCFFFVTE